MDEPDTSVHPPDAATDPALADTSMAREGWARIVAAVLGLVLAGLTIPGTDDFLLDDAWIHLAYAKSVRLGEGLSYNPGDWETGFSSPAWVALLAVWPTGVSPVLPVKLLGALLHGLTAWLSAHVVLQLVRERATVRRPLPALSMALLAGVFAAATPALLQGSTSGMEVPLTSAVILATVAAVLGRAPAAAAVTGCLAVWCRPEALGFVVAFGTVLAVLPPRTPAEAKDDSTADPLADSPAETSAETPAETRAGVLGGSLRAAAVAAMAGALLGLILWVAWCFSVSGYPWPNTQYVKGSGGSLAGLRYWVGEVLPGQPWLVSITGAVLAGLGLVHDLRSRRPELTALALAMLATSIAIAISRPLHPGTGFYEARYFIPFFAPAAVLLPFGLIGRRPVAAWLLVLPVALVSGLAVPGVRTRMVDAASDTKTVHTAVARTVAELPADAVVAVEGAGAIRVFAPRTMRVLDIVGLNDRQAAHLHFDRTAKMCHFVLAKPTHFAIPADWLGQFTPVFAMHVVARFDDPRYTQVHPPRALTVVVTEVDEIHPSWTAGCAERYGS
ncbi:MAG: hypothetical protein AAF721_08840 [Myxococcota bacterium]